MIYLYEGEESAFIVPYEKEAMLSNKVYRIRNGILDNQFLIEFYHSIENDE